ncbi:tetratricopeptide repeat protein [Paraglaciecola arctica]|uniref:tetratricopeptide repeat protein n=1 Tax=Paraglaciecola arctica TaxID=1128911 RepID=UPI001C072E90|nr:tetratricopeptide repeat protein [Paraglaciecola arctica]MBU3004754.1 hypothetical protein [Paraglaciecola arctica]
MRFTSVAVLVLLGGAILSSCSSLSPQNQAESMVETTQAEPESEPLTALQTKVNALQQQVNLYKEQSSIDNIDARVLTQFQAAVALKQQGHFIQAQQQLIALSEQHPNYSGIWLQLALISGELNKDNVEGKLGAMSSYLNKATTANPLNYQAHNELALVLRQQGQFNEALRHYELALKSWPAFSTAYFNRGILYDLYLGEKTLALADFEVYQALTKDESRQLQGWIIDLQRQIKRAEQNEQSGATL